MIIKIRKAKVPENKNIIVGIILIPETKTEIREYDLYRWRLDNRFKEFVITLSEIIYNTSRKDIIYELRSDLSP